MKRVPISLVRLRHLIAEDPARLTVFDTKMSVRLMTGLYKTLDDNSVVDLDIDDIWDKFIRLHPEFQREFSDPMFNIANNTELFNRTNTLNSDGITSHTYNRYTALLIVIELRQDIVDNLVEVRYLLGGKTYYKRVHNNQVIIIPPSIDRLYSTNKTTGIVVTI